MSAFSLPIDGLVAATYTPLNPDGSLNLDLVPEITDYLVDCGVQGLFIAGSTGEGISLTVGERELVAEAYTDAARGRMKSIIHVGDNSIATARHLAAHAASIGADGISTVAPSYFKIENVDLLLASSAAVAAGAPELPYYYYHIPMMSGVNEDMPEFVQLARKMIPNFAGLKFTCADLHQIAACLAAGGGESQVMFGIDEMLLAGLSMGAVGAVGSTYNFLAPLSNRIIADFHKGDMKSALEHQAISAKMIRVILKTCGRAGLKACMALIGLDCGPHRLPLNDASPGAIDEMRQKLDALGFFEWSARPKSQGAAN